MDPREVAELAQKEYQSLDYPAQPKKPLKKSGESNEEFGKRMDSYENDVLKWRKKVGAYREAGGRIDERFKATLLESLGLTSHPKADKLYSMAWEHGHSSGYLEVVFWAEELTELLK